MRPLETLGIGLLDLGAAVTIGIALARDLAATRSLRGAPLAVRLGQEDVPVRGNREPARACQTISKDRRLETRRDAQFGFGRARGRRGAARDRRRGVRR